MGSVGYSSSGDDLRRKYLNRKPVKEWKETFALKPDYTEQKFTFPAPSGIKSGHYVLYAAANDKFGQDDCPLLAQYVTVTSLALALQTGYGDFGGTVYRAQSGEVVADARVELWWYPPSGGRFMKLRETYKTDAEGRFVADVTKKDDYNALSRHVRVVKDGEEVLSLGSEGSGVRQG
jgi:hypothetical protein